MNYRCRKCGTLCSGNNRTACLVCGGSLNPAPTYEEQATAIARHRGLLEDARIALAFYRERMAVKEKRTRYPFGNEIEDAIRAELEADK